MATRPQPGAESDDALELPGRYQLRRHLASGGMASVWCAEDVVLGRTVAVKVLAERFRHDEMAMRRFKREARAAARVSTHAHVVTIFDVGDLAADDAPTAAGGPSAPRPFIVMEYLAGGTVADAIRVGAVRRQEALRWVREAASALDHAHARGIVHRDIKPANFLLDRSRVLHVADFGIARLVSEDTISSADELFGTAAYLAPEQALGRPATGASDLYALTVATFELLTGERPFLATHFAAQARQHIEDPPPRASDRDRTLPPSVDDVLMRGMAKQPEARFDCAAEFVAALDSAMSGGVPVSPVAFGPSARPSRVAMLPRQRDPDTATLPASTKRDALLPTATEGLAPAAAGAATAARIADRPVSAARGSASLDQRGPRSPAVRGRALALAALLVAVVAVAAVAIGSMGATRTPSAHVSAARLKKTTTTAKIAAAVKTSPRHRHPRVAATTSPAPTSPAPTEVAAAARASSAEQLQLIGHEEMLAGNYQGAIATLREAIAAAPANSTTYAYGLYDLARSMLMAGNPEGAVPILEQRLKIPNQTGVVRQMLNQALRASGQVPASMTTTSSPAGSSSPSSSTSSSSSTSPSSQSPTPPKARHLTPAASGGAALGLSHARNQRPQPPQPAGPGHPPGQAHADILVSYVR